MYNILGKNYNTYKAVLNLCKESGGSSPCLERDTKKYEKTQDVYNSRQETFKII